MPEAIRGVWAVKCGEAFDDDSRGAPLTHPGPTTGVALSELQMADALGARGRTTLGLRPD